MRKWIKSMSMRKKMVLAFAVPVIIIYCILNTVCYHFIGQKYEEQIRYSMEQSSEQAVSFLESYIQNMQYLANMIENNEEIQSVLKNPEFVTGHQDDVQYREFYNLRAQLTELELSNPTYNLGIYVADDKYYANNNDQFFKDSLLQKRTDSSQIEDCLKKNMYYLTVTQERGKNSLTLLKRIYTTGAEKIPLNICSVSMDVENIEKVMQNANVTSQGVMYLINQNGQIMVTSNKERIQSLSGDGILPHRGKTTEWEKVKVRKENFFLIRKNIQDTNWQMLALIPLKEYQKQQFFIRGFQYVMIGMIMALVIVVSVYLSRYYMRRLSDLKGQMAVVQKGNLNASLPQEENDTGDEIDEIFKNFNFMVSEVRRLMQEHYQLGKEVKLSELKALQAQINPHFLYNTLDLINWMAMDYGASDIENIVYNLSRFYRLSLNRGKNVLTIKEELEHVQVYVNIENIHFDHQIDFKMDVPEEILEKGCLNIILQPLVENAIMHGIAEIPEISHMKIMLTADIEGEDVIFHIQDDGPGIKEEQIRQIETEYMKNTGKGYGIRNINFRLKLCYGEAYGITYERGRTEGTRADVRIPLLEYENVEQRING